MAVSGTAKLPPNAFANGTPVVTPQPYSTGGGLGAGTPFGQDPTKTANVSAQQQKAKANAAAHPGPFSAMGIGKGGANAQVAGAVNPNMAHQVGATGFKSPAGGPGELPDNMGLDFSRQGAAEQYFGETKGQYTTPGMSEDFATRTQGRYANGTPGVTNNAQGAYDTAMSNKTPLEADMGKYYENAKRRAAESIDSSMAARGLYSSSAATDRIGEAFTDLEAQRAKDEAGYGLQRSAEERGWGSLGGQLAQGADSSSQAQSDNERGWISTLGDTFQGADRNALARTTAGQDAALGAQGAQRARGRDFMGDQLAMGDRMSGLAGGTYNDMMKDDQGLLDAIIGMNLGLGQEVLAGRQKTNQENKQDNAANGQTTTDLLKMFLAGA